MSGKIALFELLPGASWLTTEGEVLPVPGFHEAWLEAHRDLIGNCRNVCEVVLKFGWISVAFFGGGYVELMVPDRRSEGVRRNMFRLLGPSRGHWRKVLVMAMDEEGYAMLEPEDAESEESLAIALGSGAPPAIAAERHASAKVVGVNDGTGDIVAERSCGANADGAESGGRRLR